MGSLVVHTEVADGGRHLLTLNFSPPFFGKIDSTQICFGSHHFSNITVVMPQPRPTKTHTNSHGFDSVADDTWQYHGSKCVGGCSECCCKKSEVKSGVTTFPIPRAPCMEYLPTFIINLGEM